MEVLVSVYRVARWNVLHSAAAVTVRHPLTTTLHTFQFYQGMYLNGDDTITFFPTAPSPY